MEKFTEYERKCMLVAANWEYKFNTGMTDEDHQEFQKDCEFHKVGRLDVFAFMNDYCNY